MIIEVNNKHRLAVQIAHNNYFFGANNPNYYNYNLIMFSDKKCVLGHGFTKFYKIVNKIKR